MCNRSTLGGAGMSSLIGALELGGHLTSHGDGVLEVAGTTLGPTIVTCIPPTHFKCIDDGMLEAAGANMAVSPTGNGACNGPLTLLCPR